MNDDIIGQVSAVIVSPHIAEKAVKLVRIEQ